MKLTWPAPERNKQPILEQLAPILPAGRVLEIASGSGQHAAWFSTHLPHVTWMPTDLDPANLASIAAWRDETGAANFCEPRSLDVLAPWPYASADAIFNANMIHISPWPVTIALFAQAARVLPAGAPLVLYGPFRQEGVPFAPSNQDFDDSLRARDPSWGVRRLEDVVDVAAGFELERVVEMPANNRLVVFRRR